jgi:glycosyltransferase involved in cell wall biosynthesis
MALSDSPRVSIVIACYNHGRFLGEAIGSILSQTVAPAEIIVVDDGSTDDTAAVAGRYSRVHYLYQSNKGVSAARNRGMAESAGSHIVFLDADDRFLPGALEAGIACFARNPRCGFVFGAYRDIAVDGSVLSGTRTCRRKRDYYRALCQGNFIGMIATVMFSRAALESIQGHNTTLRTAEDYDVYLRIARNYPISHHKELVAEYRHHESSVSRDKAHMLEGSLSVLEQERRYLGTRYQRALDRGVSFWIDHYRTSRQMCETIQLLKHHGLCWPVLRQAPDFARYIGRKATRKLWGAAELVAPEWLLERW